MPRSSLGDGKETRWEDGTSAYRTAERSVGHGLGSRWRQGRRQGMGKGQLQNVPMDPAARMRT